MKHTIHWPTVQARLGRLGPGDLILHEDLERLVGPLLDCQRELDVPLVPLRHRALRKRVIEGRSVWEAVA